MFDPTSERVDALLAKADQFITDTMRDDGGVPQIFVICGESALPIVCEETPPPPTLLSFITLACIARNAWALVYISEIRFCEGLCDHDGPIHLGETQAGVLSLVMARDAAGEKLIRCKHRTMRRENGKPVLLPIEEFPEPPKLHGFLKDLLPDKASSPLEQNAAQTIFTMVAAGFLGETLH